MSVVSVRTVQKFACALSALALTTGTMLVTTATPAHAAAPATAQQWVAQAQAELDKNLFYPHDALRHHKQGLVRVSATVTRDGKLENVYVAQSAGIRSLDRAALSAVEKLDDLPPLPGAQTPRHIILQVGFGIAQSPSQEADLATAFKEQPATAVARAN